MFPLLFGDLVSFTGRPSFCSQEALFCSQEALVLLLRGPVSVARVSCLVYKELAQFLFCWGALLFVTIYLFI